MNDNVKKINRYIIYIVSMFIISLGASLSIKANLGTSPLICIPYVLSLITNLSVGTTSFLFTLLIILIAAALSIIFLGYLAGVREGTVISTIIIGPIVRIFKKYFGGHIDSIIIK